MSLYSQTTGNGPDVVLLHGWGMNSDIWEDVIEELAGSYRITVVDLPGHGRSTNDIHNPDDYTLEKLAKQISDVISLPEQQYRVR